MIYTLGETLLDIIFDIIGNVTSTPGGAMLNVAVSLARKEAAVTLISELGDDAVGSKIKGFLEENGVNTSFINFYDNSKTSLALAFLDEEAKPSYSFYKTYPEKRKLIKDMEFTSNDYLLFGSVYSLDPAIRKDILEIVHKAKSQGAVVIYDPNIRHAHHLSNLKVIDSVFENIALADIVKGSDEDFTNIFGEGDPDFWAGKIKEYNPDSMVVNTLGAKGSVLFSENRKIVKTSKPVEVVSTVGAGDAFNAGMLFKMSTLGKRLGELTFADWNTILDSGTRFAVEVCASKENYVG